jgi:hypothetical protein
VARCRCAGDICTCAIEAGAGIGITGSGGFNDPYVISAPVGSLITFASSGDVTFSVSGAGTGTSPLVITADVRCIDCAATGNPGDVLSRDASGQYVPLPVGVPAGTIFVGSGLVGDGSGGAPLRVDVCTYGDLLNICATP